MLWNGGPRRAFGAGNGGRVDIPALWRFWNAEEERPGLLLDLGFSRDITDEVLAVTMDCEKRVMNVAHES